VIIATIGTITREPEKLCLAGLLRLAIVAFMHSQLRSSSSLAIIAALALMSACPSNPSGDEVSETGTDDDGINPETGTADTTADDVETTADDDIETTADTDADTTDATEDTGTSECGNGMLEAGEECDDGNLESMDGCSSTCQSESGMVPIPCNGTIYACGDMVDNDRDGSIDLDDKECISPCDDNEGSFQTDLPGQNNDCKGDCYFDSNSGGGDDQCEWNLQCDPENPGAQVGCEYDPQMAMGPMCMAELPQECLDFCIPLIPNGCDCFGCCQIGDEFYYLDSSPDCALDNLGACEACTFYEDCGNPCMPEECELCFGQDPEDLPEGCDMPECPENFPPCLENTDCVEGTWCQTGCCVPINIG
jgi:cysteine-rich repeat protein